MLYTTLLQGVINEVAVWAKAQALHDSFSSGYSTMS